jgi:hypothetical protein
VLASADIRIIRTPIRTPRANAIAYEDQGGNAEICGGAMLLGVGHLGPIADAEAVEPPPCSAAATNDPPTK